MKHRTAARSNGVNRTMRSTPAPAAPRRRRCAFLAATGLVAALALTATACGGSVEDTASDKADAAASQAAGIGDGKLQIPADIADKLEKYGIDIDTWKDGGWKDWDRDKWVSEAKDFGNPGMHAGGGGGWYRDIVFVPAYNDLGASETRLAGASASEIAPYGNWWADWVSTSNEWIDGGSETGGAGAAYDYAVLHVSRSRAPSPSRRRSAPRSTWTSPPRSRTGRAGWAPGVTRRLRRTTI
jgi:hypothetical protein